MQWARERERGERDGESETEKGNYNPEWTAMCLEQG